MNRILLFPLLFLSVFARAQTTPELITDRPDQTESSSVVPHKFLQIETGFLLENKSNDLFKHKSFAYNSTHSRRFHLRIQLQDYFDKPIF